MVRQLIRSLHLADLGGRACAISRADAILNGAHTCPMQTLPNYQKRRVRRTDILLGVHNELNSST